MKHAALIVSTLVALGIAGAGERRPPLRPVRHDRAGVHGRRHDRDRHGQRQPRWGVDDLVRRLRHIDGLWQEDVLQERRLGLVERLRLGRSDVALARHDVPLPRRGDERQRHDHGADGIVTTTAPTAPPAVTTSDASQIGPFKASLNGAVDPNGLSTTWYFEYGTSTGYGSKTPSENAGSGTSAQGVSVVVQEPRGGCHLPLQARRGEHRGDDEGPDRTFTTDAAPP